MSKLNFLFGMTTTLVLMISSSCQTQEDIQREQMVNNISLQMVENQKLVGTASVKLQEIEERISSLNGKIEESDQSLKVNLKKTISRIEEKLSLMEEKNKIYQSSIIQIEMKLEQQDKFLKSILKSLNKMTSKKVKKKSKKSAYDQAISDYKKGRYKKSKAALQKLLRKKKLKGRRKTRAYHNLGVMSYLKEQDNDAVVYFSKLFTEYPKSSFNKSGLFYLAKSLNRMKQTEQAKATLEELIAKYPQSKKAIEAKKLLKKL